MHLIKRKGSGTGSQRPQGLTGAVGLGDSPKKKRVKSVGKDARVQLDLKKLWDYSAKGCGTGSGEEG